MDELSEDDIRRQLQQIDPYDFEKLVAELCELQGYETTVRQGSGDRGIDVEAIGQRPFKHKVLIQAKRYVGNNKVGSADVRNYATLYQQVPDVDIVVIFTTSDFTKEAERLAEDLNVRLVDIQNLIGQLKEFHSDIESFELNNSDEEDSDEENSDEEETTNEKEDYDYERVSKSDLIVEEKKRGYSKREEKYDREFDGYG